MPDPFELDEFEKQDLVLELVEAMAASAEQDRTWVPEDEEWLTDGCGNRWRVRHEGGA